MANADQDILEPVAFCGRVMNVVGGDNRQVQVTGQGGEAGDEPFLAGEKVAL